MTQRDPNDLADALAALAAGHHAEPDPHDEQHHDEQPHEDQAHVDDSAPQEIAQPPASPPPPRRPGPPAPVADGQRRPSAPVQPKPAPAAPKVIPPKPTAPASTRASRPAAPGQPASPPRPPVTPPPIRARPSTPSLQPSDTFGPMVPAPPAPTSSTSAPKPQNARPPAPARSATPSRSAPTPPASPRVVQPLQEAEAAPAEGSGSIADAVQNISAYDNIDAETAADDDAVIAPAPSADVFKPHRKAPIPRKKKDALQTRQTMIPIMLTIGVLLVGVSAVVLVAGSDSIMTDLVPIWGAIILLIGGLASLGMTAVNMMAVKKALDAAAKSS
jgi:hypothetical protein